MIFQKENNGSVKGGTVSVKISKCTPVVVSNEMLTIKLYSSITIITPSTYPTHYTSPFKLSYILCINTIIKTLFRLKHIT